MSQTSEHSLQTDQPTSAESPRTVRTQGGAVSSLTAPPSAAGCQCAELRQSETELYALLRAARQWVPSLTALAVAIDEKWPTERADHDLVWERYGNGWAWFKADLTDPDRSPQ